MKIKMTNIEKQNNKEMFYKLTIGILFLGLIVSMIYGSTLVARDIKFFNEYTIATNHIDSALLILKIAEVNYINWNEYTYSEDYFYEEARNYLDSTITDLKNSQEILQVSKIKLQSIKDKSPNKFYKDDVKLRLELLDSILAINEKRLEIIDISNGELYEINIGSKEKADIYYEQKINEIEVESKLIEDILFIQRMIDIHWEEDFY